MDAFLYFFTRLAFWNIVLATLAFLFGLLMGQWMWGQFKQRLQKTGQELLDTEAENATLKTELKAWRGKKNQTVEEKKTLDEQHANELKAARDLAGEEKSKVQKASRQLTEKEEQVRALTRELADLKKNTNSSKREKEASQTDTPKKAETNPATPGKGEPVKLSSSDSKELTELRKKLSEEKRNKASLREVIAGLKATKTELEKKVGDLQKRNQDLQEELSGNP